MILHFYKYQGAGNDFIIVNDIDGKHCLSSEQIKKLCDRRWGIGADGLIVLQNSEEYDFAMKFYNSDGNTASMCGNGGRCIAKFASDIKVAKTEMRFSADDGIHEAVILPGEIVKIKMIDIDEVKVFDDGFFANTGVPHFVKFVDNIDNVNIKYEGRKLADDKRFAPQRTNVNFVDKKNDFRLATYERGVEDETLACGTGTVATALSINTKYNIDSPIRLQAKGGNLKVYFEKVGNKYQNVWLEGPAQKVFEGHYNIYSQPKFDFHVHTTASDGTLNAKEIIAKAKNMGLNTIAITDHDTIGNVKNCIEEGRKAGIKVIPGVEMSASVQTGKMHILGLGINPDDKHFNEVMENLRKSRLERNEKIIECLNKKFNIPISLVDVKKFAKGESIGKPHIAAAIIEKGFARGNQEAFDRYLLDDEIKAIDRKKLSPKESIELITYAGGIAILAHPVSLKLSDRDTFDKIKELMSYGLQGIEAFHCNHSILQAYTYNKMAEQLGLFVTCGSDFHGIEVKNDVELGCGKNNNLPTNDEDIIKPLLEKLQ